MTMPGRGFQTGKYRFGFDNKEKDNDIYGESNAYDFGGRVYDPRLGRWLSVDPKTSKYTSWSPYNFGIDNPVNVIDPDGQDIILLIWATVDGDPGHAAIAVRNYTTEREKVNGKWKQVHNPADTYTLYELGPNDVGANLHDRIWQATALRTPTYEPSSPVTKEQILANKGADGKRISKFDGNPADGIIQFGNGTSSDYKDDNSAVTKLKSRNNKDAMYQGIGNNCTSYCSDVIPLASGESINANVTVPFNGKKVAFQGPNKLFTEAAKLKGANVIKSLPKLLSSKDYMEAFNTSSKSKYDEPKSNKVAPKGGTTIEYYHGRIM